MNVKRSVVQFETFHFLAKKKSFLLETFFSQFHLVKFNFKPQYQKYFFEFQELKNLII
jgi:hypothetical protein